MTAVFATIWQAVTNHLPVPGGGFFTQPNFFTTTISTLLRASKGEDEFDDIDLLDQLLELKFLSEERHEEIFKLLNDLKKDSEKSKNNDDSEDTDENNNSVNLGEVIEKFQSVLVEEVSKLDKEKDFESNLLEVIEKIESLNDCEFQTKIYMLDEDNNATILREKDDCENALLVLPSGALAVFYQSQEELANTIKSKIVDLIENNVKKIEEGKEETIEPSLHVPKFLHDYVKKMMTRFVKNAVMVAFQMTEGESYKIATMEGAKEEDGHIFDSIIPVDFASTGVLEKNKRYSDGIQQFLEMKHQLSISDVTLTTNFLSNFSFYTRFKEIHGLTGKLQMLAWIGKPNENFL